MQEQKPVRRGVYILPNLFTTASLFTGFLAMLLAVQGNIEGSALAILFSALMDGLDGKVARLTNTASEFGIQYDSLADLVAFGVAPAFTSWMWVLEGYGKLGIGVAFLYVACTALILSQPVVFGFLLGAIYLLSGPIYTYIILPRRNRQLLGSLTQN